MTESSPTENRILTLRIRNFSPLLQLLLLLSSAAAADASTTNLYHCPDLDATSFDRLFSEAGGGKAIVRLNYSQLPEVLYNNNSEASAVSASWLLLLYNPFGGRSIQYAAEFGRFAALIAKWSHTVRIAAINVEFPQENAVALRQFEVRALPAVFFVPKDARWGQTNAHQMPRDSMFLEDILLSELETFVVRLKPTLININRLLRISSQDTIVFIEESPDGSDGGLIARRAVMDFLQAVPQMRIVWRYDNKLGAGRVRLTSYRKRPNRRIGAYDRLRSIEREATSDTLDSAGLLRILRLDDRQTTIAPLAAPRAIAHTPEDAFGCIADAALNPPKSTDLLADAARLLRSNITDCLFDSKNGNLAWPAVVRFVRLMAGALRTAAPVLTLATAALTRLESRPDPLHWRLTLDRWLDINVRGETKDGVWRLLHAMAAARVRSPELQSVLKALQLLRQACPLAKLPKLPLSTDAEDSPVEEVLALWRLHNRARGRVFPPPSLCPSCLLDDGAGKAGVEDALMFLTDWYSAVYETVQWPSRQLQLRRPQRLRQFWGTLSTESDEESSLPCIMRLFGEGWSRGGGGRINWRHLAALLSLSCFFCLVILLMILLILRP